MGASIGEASWEEFREAGLLWWLNRSLHLFGWCIVCEIEENGQVSRVFPARTCYRGFAAEDEADGFRRLTEHVNAERERLLSEVE